MDMYCEARLYKVQLYVCILRKVMNGALGRQLYSVSGERFLFFLPSLVYWPHPPFYFDNCYQYTTRCKCSIPLPQEFPEMRVTAISFPRSIPHRPWLCKDYGMLGIHRWMICTFHIRTLFHLAMTERTIDKQSLMWRDRALSDLLCFRVSVFTLGTKGLYRKPLAYSTTTPAHCESVVDTVTLLAAVISSGAKNWEAAALS